jgi:hypothetical protein
LARLAFRYRFAFDGGKEAVYDLTVDAETMAAEAPPGSRLPPWTALCFEQCSNCPLPVDASAACPLAASLAALVTSCAAVLSHEGVRLEVVTPERTVLVDTTAQRAIGSLMGLLMPCSGCPHTAYFRPMARFHLPCASEEETIYRASSMYLLAAYLRRQEGLEADGGLAGLSHIYRELHEVNKAMARRLHAAVVQDATVNAVILLDLFAKAMPYAIDDSLAVLRTLFRSYRGS